MRPTKILWVLLSKGGWKECMVESISSLPLVLLWKLLLFHWSKDTVNLETHHHYAPLSEKSHAIEAVAHYFLISWVTGHNLISRFRNVKTLCLVVEEIQDFLVAQWWRICLQCWRGRFDPGLERSPREGNGNPLQYSCLGNPMDRGT